MTMKNNQSEPLMPTGITVRRVVNLGNFESLHLEVQFAINEVMSVRDAVNLADSQLKAECDRLEAEHKSKSKPTKPKKAYDASKSSETINYDENPI